jgi:hypothetical protein
MIELWILIDRNMNTNYFFFVDLTLEKLSTIDPGFIILNYDFIIQIFLLLRICFNISLGISRSKNSLIFSISMQLSVHKFINLDKSC